METAVLMTVHNRKDKTLACLYSFMPQAVSLTAEGRFAFSIWMTDDGCTDGTADAVVSAFPHVHIVKGDGNLYWNRGMCAAWSASLPSCPDFFLWLNDDILLKPGALQTLFEISFAMGHKAIVVGTAEGSDGTLSYGGRTRKGRIIVPDRTIPVGCDIFNGNLVLVPRHVFDRIGILDHFYTHGFGDYDYGIRAEKAGLVSVVAPGVLAVCDRNPGIPVWRDSSYRLRERYRALSRPVGRPFREQFVYDIRSGGLLWAVFHFISLNLKVLFPVMK